MKVYLAGPDVFSPEARNILRQKAAICNENGLVPLSPLDNEVPSGEEAAGAIYRGNRGLMDAAKAIIANLSPFRGVSLDPGVAFEIGYMAAQGKLVCGYSNVGSELSERVSECFGRRETRDTLGRPVAGDGSAIENFGHPDNLMIVEAIRESGGILVLPEGEGESSDLAALEQFSKCVRRLVAFARERRRTVVG